MFQRQSLRSDRTGAAFTQRRRHFFGEPIHGTFADAYLHTTINQRSHHIACESVRNDGEAEQSGFDRRRAISLPHRISVVDQRMLRYTTPIRGFDLAYGGASRIRGCERAEIMQADSHFSCLVHSFDVEIIVDMQHAIADTWINFA